MTAPRTTDRPSAIAKHRLAMRRKRLPHVIPPPGGAIPIRWREDATYYLMLAIIDRLDRLAGGDQE